MSGISSVGAVEYLSTRLQPVTALARPDAVQINAYRNPLEITATDNVRHTLLLRDTVDEISESLAIVQITDNELRTVGDYLTKIQAKLNTLTKASSAEAEILKKEIKDLEDAMSAYLGQKVLSRENPVLKNFAKVSGQHQRRFFEVVGNKDYPEIQAKALAAIEVNLNYLIKEHHDPSQCPMCQSSRSLKKLEGTSVGTLPKVTEDGKGVVAIDPVEALLIGSKWNVAEGENLTYSFYQDPNVGFAYEEAPSVVSTIGDIEESLDQAFTSWNSVAGLSLQKVEEVDGKVGAIRSAFTDSFNTEGAVAFSYQPGATAGHGDIFYNYEQFPSEDFTVGSFAYYTALHEIGHALGLSHTHQDAGGSYLGKELVESEDTIRNSVMSYGIKDRNTVIVEKDGQLEAQTIYASTPMRYDIQAMEALYGRSTTSNVGDTVYQWADRVQTLETIYDSDGIDTLDASNQTQEVHINLQPGSFQSIGIWSEEEQVQHYVEKGYGDKQTIEQFLEVLNGGAKDARALYTGEDNVAIAYSSYIENAIGGQRDDILIGNDLDNVLKGNAGNNILVGGRGYDTAVYDGKRDDYKIEQNLDSSYSLTNLQTKEVDTLKEIENIQFEDEAFSFSTKHHAQIHFEGKVVVAPIHKNVEFELESENLEKLKGVSEVINLTGGSANSTQAFDPLQRTGINVQLNLSDAGISAALIHVVSGDVELNFNSSHLTFNTIEGNNIRISSQNSTLIEAFLNGAASTTGVITSLNNTTLVQKGGELSGRFAYFGNHSVGRDLSVDFDDRGAYKSMSAAIVGGNMAVHVSAAGTPHFWGNTTVIGRAVIHDGAPSGSSPSDHFINVAGNYDVTISDHSSSGKTNLYLNHTYVGNDFSLGYSATSFAIASADMINLNSVTVSGDASLKFEGASVQLSVTAFSVAGDLTLDLSSATVLVDTNSLPIVSSMDFSAGGDVKVILNESSFPWIVSNYGTTNLTGSSVTIQAVGDQRFYPDSYISSIQTLGTTQISISSGHVQAIDFISAGESLSINSDGGTVWISAGNIGSTLSIAGESADIYLGSVINGIDPLIVDGATSITLADEGRAQLFNFVANSDVYFEQQGKNSYVAIYNDMWTAESVLFSAKGNVSFSISSAENAVSVLSAVDTKGNFSFIAENSSFGNILLDDIHASGDISVSLTNSTGFGGDASGDGEKFKTLNGNNIYISANNSQTNSSSAFSFSALNAVKNIEFNNNVSAGSTVIRNISAGNNVAVNIDVSGGNNFFAVQISSANILGDLSLIETGNDANSGRSELRLGGSDDAEYTALGTPNQSVSVSGAVSIGTTVFDFVSIRSLDSQGSFMLSGEANGLNLLHLNVSGDLVIDMSNASANPASNSLTYFAPQSKILAVSVETASTFQLIGPSEGGLSAQISDLTIGKSGWSILMPEVSSSTLTLNVAYSGGGILKAGFGQSLISAQSVFKGGNTQVDFDLGNDNAVDQLWFTPKDSRDFITINNFKAEDTLKISNTGTSQRPFVATANAAALIGTAIGKDVFEADLTVASSVGVVQGYVYKGDTYLVGFSDGDDQFEKGEIVVKLANTTDPNLSNVSLYSNPGDDSTFSTIPEVISTNIQRDLSNVNITSPITLTFDQDIVAQSSNDSIILQRKTGEMIETFSSSHAGISISGTTVTITPSEKFDADTSYILTIPDDFFTNRSSGSAAGKQIEFKTKKIYGAPEKSYTPIVLTNARLNLEAFPSLANFSIPQTILDNVLAVLEGREAEPHGLIGEDLNDPEALLNFINALQATIAEVDAQRAALGSVTGTLDERMQVVAASQNGDISAEAADSPVVAATLLELIKAQLQSLIDEQLSALSNISEPIVLELLNND